MGDLPLVVLLGEDRADEPDDRRPVGKDPDDVAAAAQLAVEPLLRIGRPDLSPVVAIEVREGQQLLARLGEQCRGVGEAMPELG